MCGVECMLLPSLLLHEGLFDHDGNGTIDLREFQQLWQYINTWKGVFDRYDRDKSGNIDGNELYTGRNISFNHLYLL